VGDYHCAMCNEGYAYVDGNCVLKTTLSAGIDACRVELGWTISQAADEGSCYSCNEGFLLDEGRNTCNRPFGDGTVIGRKILVR
jgi:hypothetical protein